jgi:putative spermidine/putrescine transport system permease protein
VGAYFVIVLFSRTGIISRVIYKSGLINNFEQFPVLTNDLFGAGIILTFTWKASPFILLMVYPVLLRIEEKWQNVAEVFGAGSFSFFRNVIFKMIWPAWLSSVFIIFAFAFSTFEAPYILGVTYPKALSVLSYEIFSNRDFEHRPEAMALGIIIVVITAFFGIAIYFLNSRWIKDAAKKW